MATMTNNYELILPTGDDRVNPLTQVNPNFETIDAQMKTNANSGIGVANEIKTGTVHALTRITNNGDCAVFRFLATSDFHLGDSFTVDGISVTALLPSGEVLKDGAYVIGSTVLCILVETRLTVYATGGTASDANALNGEPASYYLDANNEVFDNAGTDLVATNTESAIKEVYNNNAQQTIINRQTVTINFNNTDYARAYLQATPIQGYKPIGIVGFYTSDSTSLMLVSSYVDTENMLLFGVRHNGAITTTISYILTVEYVKE